MAIRKTKKDNKQMQEKLQAEIETAKQQQNTQTVSPAVPNASEDNTQKDSASPNEQRVIVIKDENGNDRQVGISGDPNAEKFLSGKAVQNSWDSIANANIGDFWIGSDDQIHVVTQRDINYSKQQLKKPAGDNEPNGAGDATSPNSQPTNKTTKANSGDGLLGRLKATSADLNERKANPDGEYTGIPGENAQGNALGYRSVINDIKDVAYTNNDLQAARLNDSVRQEAIAAKKEAKSVANDIKKYDREYTDLLGTLEKTNKKSEKMVIKGLINERKAKLDELQGQVDSINSEFEKKYGMTINEAMSGSDKNAEALEAAGIDPEALSVLAGEKYGEIADLLGQRAEVNEQLDYISDSIKGDIETLLQPNTDSDKLKEVYARIDQITPELSKVLKDKVNLNKNTLDSLGEVIEGIDDPDVKEAYQNLQGMAQGFLEQKIDIANPETLKALQTYEKDFSDIIKNQEMYDKDTRYANDMRLSAVNRLMFNIFDDIKSAIVFAAAIESGNPQAVRSALDMYNYKIQEAENKRKTDQYGAYTENRIREITQDNIARFRKITEIDPDIAKLEKVLNIQEGEAGKRQMDALEAGFEEFNKYKQEHPGEAIDFAAWVSAYKNEGGIAGQIISALLMNFPGLKKAIENNINKANSAAGDYASGGIVPGNSYSGDNLTANVNSGEMILNQEQQANLWNLINNGSNKKKTASFLDNAISKSSKKKEPEKEKDPALMMDMQNTVGQALASRVAPPQANAPQAGAPKTSNGFGRTNLA